MFERTSLRRPSDITGLGALDLGALAESLLFYGQTSLVLDPGSLPDLVHAIGPHETVRLARFETVRMFYEPDMTTVPMAGDVPAPGWGISVASVPDWQLDMLLPTVFEDVLGRRGAARRASEKVLDRVETITPQSLRPQSNEELLREVISEDAVRELLTYVAPSYTPPQPLVFAVGIGQDDHLSAVETNLDFDAITTAYQSAYNSANRMGSMDLVLSLVGIQEDVGLAAYLNSDITLTPLRSSLIQLRGTSITSSESEQIGRLQEFAFDNSRAISEAVNAGQIPFNDVLDLAERADRFRHWLAGQPADADLAKEFFREATKETWVDSLPGAVARWLLVTGSSTAVGVAAAGPAGVAAGPVIGSVDFIADRLRRRWTPGQFLLRRVRRKLGL